MKNLKYYDIVGMSFVAVLLVSTVAAQKLFAFGPFTLTAGIIVFPFAYIFGDILTEVYGYAKARRVVWIGFAANLFLAIICVIATALPPAPGWPFQNEFASVLNFVPRIVIASLIAYLMGEFVNSFVMAKMKVRTQGKHLWARTIGSTVVGQGVDTVIFALIAFWGVLPGSVLLAMMASGYLFKVAYEVLVTPFTYVIVKKLKKAEGVDHFDIGTNFSPFRLD